MKRAPDMHFPGVIDEIRRRAGEDPEHIAIIDCDGSRVAYGALLECVERAHRAIEAATAPGSIVALRLHNGSEFASAFLGGLSARRIVFPLHPGTPVAEIEALRARCGMAALIEPGLSVQPQPTLAPADPAQMPGGLLLQTSGTTARPKLVLRDLPSLGAVGANVGASAQLTRRDTVLGAIPMCHSYGMENAVLGPLMAGSTVLAIDGFDLLGAAAALQRSCTVFPGAPFMFDALGHVEPSAAPALRLAYSAGSPLPAPVVERFAARWGVPIGQLYGASDIGSVTFNHPRAEGFDPACAGLLMRGVSLRILDEDHRHVPTGAEGQVAVRAPSMLTRYVDGPAAPLHDGHFLTGDLGRLDSRGRLTITGRISLLVDVGGAKVNPVEIELVLIEHPKVRRCVVVPLKLSETVTRLRAIYEPVDQPASAQELRSFLRMRLASHKIPRIFEACDALPSSPAGKVLRQEVLAS